MFGSDHSKYVLFDTMSTQGRPKSVVAPLLVRNHAVGEAKRLQFLYRVVHGEIVPPPRPQLHHQDPRVAEVVQPLELVHRPLVPPHEEHPERETVRHQHQIHVASRRGGALEATHVNVRTERLPEPYKE